jgi:threonine/homoserine/homoserine lactone efflux protein
MTSWQVVKMALMGATTALVAATIIAPAVATPAAAAEFMRRPQADGPDVITISAKSNLVMTRNSPSSHGASKTQSSS